MEFTVYFAIRLLVSFIMFDFTAGPPKQKLESLHQSTIYQPALRLRTFTNSRGCVVAWHHPQFI